MMEETRVDCELPSKMAGLDLMEIEKQTSEDVEQPTELSNLQSRVLRKRKSLAIEQPKSTNRRVSMKPRKRVLSESATTKQIEALYLNKTVKTTSQTLETIYEESSDSADPNKLIGSRKVKRLLTFHLQYPKEKIKKRRAKIKKLLGKSFLNRKKIPMQVFLKTIDGLELNEGPQQENTAEHC